MSDRRGGGVPRYTVTERHNGSTRDASIVRILSVAGDETQPMTAMAVERTLAARAYYWGKVQRHRVIPPVSEAIALGLGFEVWAGQTRIAEVTSHEQR